MMKLAKIFTFILLFASFFSCDKIGQTRSAGKAESMENIVSSDQEIGTASNAKKADKNDLFNRLAYAIYDKDLQAYEVDIEKFKNIDSLVLYTPNGEEYESYYSLLGLACKFNNLEVVRDLVKKGANINIGSEDETYAQDAMYYAITGANAEIVKILIDKGSNLNNLYTENGMTPLILAVMDKKYLMAKILLDHGSKVDGYTDLQAEYIYNPLRLAIEQEDVEMVKILLKYKANIHLKDSQGRDAKALAKDKKSKEIMQLLEKVN